MRIAVLVYSTFRNDARVEKAAETYVAAGHDVLIVALADAAPSPPAKMQVARVDLRPNIVFRKRPPAELQPHGFSRDVLTDAAHFRAYLWSAERFLLSRLRLVSTLFTGARLWLQSRRSGRAAPTPYAPGGILSLVRFADRIRGYRLYATRMSRALKRAGFRPDLVHANDFNTLFAAELLLEHHGIPFVYDSHELWSERNRADSNVHPYEDQWELETERRIARKAAGLVTVSESIAEHMARAFAVPQPVVIRNVPYASRRVHPRGLREMLGLSAGTKLIVYTGRATFNRGLEEAVDALALLPSNVHLLVLGNYAPGFKAVLDARIGERNLRARVHHYGPVPSEEVPSWVSEGDVSLVPIKGVCLSYEYCLPNKLFEGIQAGLPIVATNLVEMKRTLEEYDCGLTYESGNVADLKAKIEHILGTPGLAERLRANAAKAARQLNWETEKARLLELLDAMPRASAVPRA